MANADEEEDDEESMAVDTPSVDSTDKEPTQGNNEVSTVKYAC